MDDKDLEDLYAWIDEIPLSRQKRNISRDFSDGVLVAEVIRHFIPKIVELHNYQPASAVKQKLENWHVLQRKVFKKLRLVVPENVLEGVTQQTPGVVEVVLNNIRLKIQQYLLNERQGSNTKSPKPRTTDHTSSPRATKKTLGVHAASPPTSPNKIDEEYRAPTTTINRSRGKKSSEDPYSIIEAQKKELVDCHETIGILKLKIEKLEQLLALKDQKIDGQTTILVIGFILIVLCRS
eukprot:m.316040 g.316040  ORF g.316040 m.316040 type:complete len:237 (+) comp16499_c0_seq8:254-964(+)